MQTQTDPAPQFTNEYKQQHIRPWIRYFARMLDIVFVGFLIGFIEGILGFSFFTSLPNAALGMLAVFILALIEPIYLCFFGTTPGKWLLRISLEPIDKKPFQFSAALFRSFYVWFAGYGAGVPIFSLVMIIFGYRTLTKTGTTWWDQNRFIVTHGKIGVTRTLIASFLLLGVLGLSVYEAVYPFLPYDKNQLAADIEAYNKELPESLDADVELTHAALDQNKNTVYFSYRLLHNIATPSKTELLKEICKDPSTQKILRSQFNISYEYNDKSLKPVTTITVSPSDCKLERN